MSEVGLGVQRHACERQLPVAFRQAGEGNVALGPLTTPAIVDSTLPGLVGLSALGKISAVLGFHAAELHFCGQDNCDLLSKLPPGSERCQGKPAP